MLQAYRRNVLFIILMFSSFIKILSCNNNIEDTNKHNSIYFIINKGSFFSKDQKEGKKKFLLDRSDILLIIVVIFIVFYSIFLVKNSSTTMNVKTQDKKEKIDIEIEEKVEEKPEDIVGKIQTEEIS